MFFWAGYRPQNSRAVAFNGTHDKDPQLKEAATCCLLGAGTHKIITEGRSVMSSQR